MKFAPKFKNECSACVFLGHHVFTTVLWSATRRVGVDLYCCTGVDPSVIARYGDESHYASCPTDMLASLERANGTYSEGLREAMRRALALKLVKSPSAPKTDWTNGDSIRIIIDVQASTIDKALAMIDMANAPAVALMEGKGGEWEEFVEDGRMSARVSFAPWVHNPQRPTTPPKPETKTTTIPSPSPLDPLTFLHGLVADAIERAERLERWDAERLESLVRDGVHSDRVRAIVDYTKQYHIETARRYRARAEAHKIAIVELERAMAANPSPSTGATS
jgi:hypothetical protein